MQQRQPRLGDILDDYCPRERRVTNHVVVAMVEADVKQTRCTTCDAEHEFKHAKVPRQRRKADTPAALYAQVAANGPKRIVHEAAPPAGDAMAVELAEVLDAVQEQVAIVAEQAASGNGSGLHAEEAVAAAESVDVEMDVDGGDDDDRAGEEDGPVHRPLIRASLPRHEGQPPPTRPIPEFTIRQPAGRPNRFRPRGPRAGQPFQGNRSNSGNQPGGPPRGMRSSGGGRTPQGSMPSHLPRRHGPPGGRKRSK